METLRDKVSLVTGATRGIGRAIARMLLQEGAQVAICARDGAALHRAVEELAHASGSDKVKGKVADVSNDEQVGELFRFVDAEFGGLDVLVNNAGVGVFAPVWELSMQAWKQTMETNLSGAFYCSREALRRFALRPQGPGRGYIVNISSLAGRNAFAGGAAYNASKFGLTGFSEALMQDARSQGVRVSTVMPGSVATAFGGTLEPGSDWKIWPEDVAEVVKMLLRMPPRTLVSCVEIRPAVTGSGPKRTK
jgi:NAD(P)-dependent dehydrogenase (short-subunit alcohol dehydrogenase family)